MAPISKEPPMRLGKNPGMKIPKRFTKPLVTKTLVLKLPHGVDPDGVVADIPAAAAAAAAKTKKPGDSSEFDIRLLIHLMRRQLSKLDPKAVGDPQEYIRQMRLGFAPRDKFEEVLTASILLTYGRLAHLSHVAANCTDELDLLPLYSAAERTANGLRRQLICLANYRAPTFTAIVSDGKTEKSTIELGFDHAQETLPPDQKGFAFPPRRESDKHAVGQIDRPQNPAGKDPVQAQRL
jgi:hypothetical protein